MWGFPYINRGARPTDTSPDRGKDRTMGSPASRKRRSVETGGGQRPLTARSRQARRAVSCPTREPERELVLAAKRGGERDRERLVTAYLPSIATVARRYRRQQGVSWKELTQEGVVGLLRALQRYDTARDVPFWAYASWWVRQAMQQVVSELSGPLVLSDRALRQLARIRLAERIFEQEHGRPATNAALAASVGLPRGQVEHLITAGRRWRGLDEPVGGDSSEATTLGERLSDPPAEEAFELVPQRLAVADLPRLLNLLSEREREVLRARFGIGTTMRTLREVAGGLGVSAERVRQIEQGAIEKLHGEVLGSGLPASSS